MARENGTQSGGEGNENDMSFLITGEGDQKGDGGKS